MASFTVTAAPFGRHVRVTWTDGELSGSRWIVDVVTAQAERYRDRYIMTPHGAVRGDHLADPWATWALIRMALGESCQITAGSLPQVERTP